MIGVLLPFFRRNTQFGPIEVFSVALPLSLLAGGFLCWRVARIHWFFARGLRLPARILDLRIVRDRGRLEFAYNLNGRTFCAWTPVHKNRQVLKLRPNQEVEVLVDPDRPTKAIVYHLYV